MAQTREECLIFLNKARDALDELSLLDDQEKQLNQEEKQLSQSLSAEKKLIADTIQQTIKKRREEINTTYDKEIDKAQTLLKKAKARREKAKNQGIKERIGSETAALKEQNQELGTQLKTLFKCHHVPRFCRSPLYYSLYFPYRIKEYFFLFLGILALFLALPYGIYLLLPKQEILYLALIYLAVILLFGGGYVLIGNRTKMQHKDPLQKGLEIQKQIRSNKRKIKAIISDIRKDKNESLYNLKKFDDEIAHLQQELKDVLAKKADALNTFETVTKNILSDEIEHNHKEKLDQLQQEYERATKELRDVSQQVKKKRLDITDQYGTYLGNDFLDPLKIVELCTIIQNGQASNISEAIDCFHAMQKHT